MKKLLAVAVLAAFSTMSYAADKVLNADIVVVGQGAAGTAAAFAAAEKGAKVIGLEKKAIAGGTGNFSEGIFAVGSKMQRDYYIPLTKDEAFKKIMAYGHWRSNARLVRAFVDKSADTVDWMQKHGVKFEKLTTNYPGGLYTWHIYEGRGAGWIKLFQEKGQKEYGMEVLFNTPAEKLLMKDGKVAGVIAKDKDGNTVTVNAKAVIIATGGFADNPEMMKKYTRFPDTDGLAQSGKNGVGIQMAWSAGGGKEGLEVQQSYRPGPRAVGTTNHVSATAKQPHLWLTPQGERFTDETIMGDWPAAGNALERIGGQMWVVYDNKNLDSMKHDGIVQGVGVMVPIGAKLTNFDKEWDAAEKAGWAVKGNTLDELAKKTGMDPAKLKASVGQYNQAAEQRHDALFAKDPQYIFPVKQGPFYAIKSVASSLGTLGGIKVNDRLQVVTDKDKAIPNLYAAGSDVGGMYGDSYDLLMAGSTIGFAVNSARIAAESAIKDHNIAAKK
ncbi:FAD-dependent oxidoreductase [uncultured Parasutterella sp.]|uniref:FAD-dependent oxidoreductase n=1 Tax=uncultured Parasutterella sp. TaxID=1263098 RepID=UPI002593B288|nr:FAD-dependent oxidoreductase [uncultured Parasutterella sp.]